MTSALTPAATLILMCDRLDDVPELLMVRRAATLAFAGDAWVFPGGRIDTGDRELAATLGSGEELAGRIAAIRETIEEVGLAVGLDPVPGRATVLDMQAKLLAGEPFAALLAEAGLRCDPAVLVPFARWLPPERAPRRFDTRFYIARVEETRPATLHGAECVEARWTTARAMLDDAAAERAAVIFPTRANLHRLSRYASYAAAVADAAAYPVRRLEPLISVRNGRRHVSVPSGFGYPDLIDPL